MKKRVFLLGTALLLAIVSIAGCGQNTDQKTDSQTDAVEEVSGEENVSSGAYISFGDIDQEEFVRKLEDTDISDTSLLVGITMDYDERVVDQLNQLLKQEGCDFDVVFCRIPDQCCLDRNLESFAQYLQEQDVQMDILPVWDDDLRALVNDGLLTDLTSQIRESEIYDLYPEVYYELTSIDGKNYGLGSCCFKAKNWAVNQELMKKYGFTEDDLSKDITELESVLEMVSEGETDAGFTAFIYNPRFFLENIEFSYVDDRLPIGYWLDDDTDRTTVESLFDTERMKALVETMNRYYQMGYAAVTDDLIANSNFFLQASQDTYPVRRSDSLDTWSNSSGLQLVRVPYAAQEERQLVYTVNAIPSWSEKKEMAWEFLSFVNKNEDASMLLLYGIEGEAYSVLEGAAVTENFDLETISFNRSLGNHWITTPLAPFEDEQKNELMENELNALVDTPLKGFVFDEEPVREQVDAVEALYSELSYFREMFAYNAADSDSNWEDYYNDYSQKLKAAGIDEIVDEMNRQIQEFLNE